MRARRHYRYRNYKFRSITVINDAYVLEFAIGLLEFAFIRPSALSTSVARALYSLATVARYRGSTVR